MRINLVLLALILPLATSNFNDVNVDAVVNKFDKQMCQARTALTSGVISVQHTMTGSNLENREGGDVVLLGLFEKAGEDVCSSKIPLKEFKRIDQLIKDPKLKIEAFVEERRKEINEMIMTQNGDKEGIANILKYEGRLLNYGLKEKLSLDDWFSNLNSQKQDLLFQYTQIRLQKADAVQKLKIIHSEISNFNNTIIMGEQIDLHAEYLEELNYVWEQFQKIKKDDQGDMILGPSYNDWLIISERIDKAMTSIINMLTTGHTLGVPSIWEHDGFCHRSALSYFKNIIEQSQSLKSTAMRMRGLELSIFEKQTFKNAMNNIALKYESTCQVPPASTKILQREEDGSIKFRPDEKLTLNCQVKDSKPEAKIKWKISPQMYNAWKDSYNIVVETGVDKNLLTTTSSIELLPTIKDHLADVTCEVSHVSYDNPVQLTATLLYVIDCEVSDWTEWSSCSKTCGSGFQKRERSIVKQPKNNGKPCEGNLDETKTCELEECYSLKWSDWSEWSQCSLTCGSSSIKKRTRHCKLSLFRAFRGICNDGKVDEETAKCETKNCSGLKWSDWSKWSQCSLTCGSSSIKKRTRHCKLSFFRAFRGICNDGKVDEETAKCETKNCPVNCQWSSWRPYSQCTKSCGGGIKWKTRYKTIKESNGGTCSGEEEDTTNCNDQSCPVNCQWSSWSSYSECAKSCGGGTKHKTREKTITESNGGNCSGEREYTTVCNNQNCPVNCQWSSWRPYSDCTKSCGGGTKRKTRYKITTESNGGTCSGEQKYATTCNNQSCPSGIVLDNQNLGCLFKIGGVFLAGCDDGDEKKLNEMLNGKLDAIQRIMAREFTKLKEITESNGMKLPVLMLMQQTVINSGIKDILTIHSP